MSSTEQRELEGAPALTPSALTQSAPAPSAPAPSAPAPSAPAPSALTPSEMTATEAAIAEMWRSLFGLDHVGVGDDFFELGGNSLTAIKFLARVEERFGVDALLPETLYDDARLGSLARSIDEAAA